MPQVAKNPSQCFGSLMTEVDRAVTCNWTYWLAAVQESVIGSQREKVGTRHKHSRGQVQDVLC